MNRESKRKSKKQSKQQHLLLTTRYTDSEIHSIKNKAFSAGINFAVNNISTAFLAAFNEEFNIGEKRMLPAILKARENAKLLINNPEEYKKLKEKLLKKKITPDLFSSI